MGFQVIDEAGLRLFTLEVDSNCQPLLGDSIKFRDQVYQITGRLWGCQGRYEGHVGCLSNPTLVVRAL